MAEVIRQETRDGRTVLIYDSGLERDAETGYIIKPPSHVLITADNTNAYHRKKKEHKRAVVIEAANMGVQRAELVERFGESAYIAAVIQSAMVKAQNSKDPKAIEAARFVFSESGISESAPDNDTDSGVPKVSARVFVLLAELNRRRGDGGDGGAPMFVDAVPS